MRQFERVRSMKSARTQLGPERCQGQWRQRGSFVVVILNKWKEFVVFLGERLFIIEKRLKQLIVCGLDVRILIASTVRDRLEVALEGCGELAQGHARFN